MELQLNGTDSGEQSTSSKLILVLLFKKVHLLLNLKIHYLSHKIPPFVPILMQMNPMHPH
jgi:hypothetical protein